MMGLQLFDQRIMRTRVLDAYDHEAVEMKMRELIEKLLERYTEEIRQPARIFVSWISGVRRNEPRSAEEAETLKNMVTLRESAILPNNMEALRVYADLVAIGGEVAAARIKMIEEKTRQHKHKPFKVISNPYQPTIPQNDGRKAAIRRVV